MFLLIQFYGSMEVTRSHTSKQQGLYFQLKEPDDVSIERYKIIKNQIRLRNSPFGITPGSMKVASVKLAKTKNVMTP